MKIFEAPATFERRQVATLMRLADDSEQALHKYFHLGRLFLLQSERELSAIGQLLVLQLGDNQVEIKSLAIAPERQRSGLGTLLVKEVLARLQKEGISRVLVATSTADIHNIGFYQKLGFRCLKIERDVFTSNNGYPDELRSDRILVRDKIWLDQYL